MRSKNNIIKLSKEDINYLLYNLQKDNFEYGLILKLIYIYGKNVGEILRLKIKHIDFKHNAIDFISLYNNKSFPLIKEIHSDLSEYIDKNKDNDAYLFINNDEEINYYSKKLNQYLKVFIKEFNSKGLLDKHCPSLVSSDFKRLRGQHLFFDGVDIKMINELFINKNIQSTERFINYNDLLSLRNTCSSVDNLFKEFTDLNVYMDYDFLNNDMFIISKNGVSIVLEYNYLDGSINIIDGDDDILINFSNDFFKENNINKLLKLNMGNYIYINGFKIMKN